MKDKLRCFCNAKLLHYAEGERLSTSAGDAQSRLALPQPIYQVSDDSTSARNIPWRGTLKSLFLSDCKRPKLYSPCLLERFLKKERKKPNICDLSLLGNTAVCINFLPLFSPITSQVSIVLNICLSPSAFKYLLICVLFPLVITYWPPHIEPM